MKILQENLLRKKRLQFFFLPGKLGAISSAHSTSDIKSMIAASTRFSEKI